MRRSTLGFHTVDMVLRLTHDETERLIKHFYRHSKQPGTIRMLMLTTLPGGEKEWREYSPIHMGTRLVLPLNLKISYPDKDHGVKWMLRSDMQSDAYKEYTIEATINPKILGGSCDYINAATEDDMEVAAINFNRMARSISPVLRTFA